MEVISCCRKSDFPLGTFLPDYGVRWDLSDWLPWLSMFHFSMIFMSPLRQTVRPFPGTLICISLEKIWNLLLLCFAPVPPACIAVSPCEWKLYIRDTQILKLFNNLLLKNAYLFGDGSVNFGIHLLKSMQSIKIQNL